MKTQSIRVDPSLKASRNHHKKCIHIRCREGTVKALQKHRESTMPARTPPPRTYHASPCTSMKASETLCKSPYTSTRVSSTPIKVSRKPHEISRERTPRHRTRVHVRTTKAPLERSHTTAKLLVSRRHHFFRKAHTPIRPNSLRMKALSGYVGKRGGGGGRASRPLRFWLAGLPPPNRGSTSQTPNLRILAIPCILFCSSISVACRVRGQSFSNNIGPGRGSEFLPAGTL